MERQMNRRQLLKGVGSATLAISTSKTGFLGVTAAGQRKNKPNFLFILIDDMGWVDLTCYGSKFHETPNIDRLAKEGIRFTDAYAAGPVCSPTRASILAGQYPARVGITDFIPGHYRPWAKLTVPENRLELPLESVTFAEVLKKHGYATGYIGKWHLGDREHGPEQQGFQNIAPKGRNQNDKQVTSFTDAATEFIRNNTEEPFLLFLSHHSVHIPLEAPAQLIEKYENKPKPSQGINNPVYAAMVEHLDNSVGRIIKELDECGLTQQTVVIFFSDNGGLWQRYDGQGDIVTSNSPLRAEKGTLYEGGIRVPLIICWPGTIKSGICDVPVCSNDFYPTLLQLAGAKTDPRHVLDGESIVPLLTGRRKFKRDAIFWHYPHYHHSTPAGAIRQGDWKLIEFYEDGRAELYNLKSDISEKNNLAEKLVPSPSTALRVNSVEGMPGKAVELKERLAAWRKSVGAKMPTPNPDYDPGRAGEWGTRQPGKSVK